MKICECGHPKETHFLKDGACYGFIMVDGEAQRCPCNRFKKRSRKFNNHSPTEIGSQPNRSESLKEEDTQSQTINQEEFEEWAGELKQVIHNYLINKGSFKIKELEELIDKKVKEALA